MIKRADASGIKREVATKEQIAENFKRLAIDSSKKVELKPSLLKTVKTLDGKTFGIIHENKSYYLKYTVKQGSENPIDFKHLDGLNSNFSIEKYNNFQKAVNKLTFICEAQNNAHKLRLLTEAEEEETEETPKEKVVSKTDQDKLLKDLDTKKDQAATPAAPAADMGGELPPAEPAADMGGELPPAEAPAADMGGQAPAADAPVDTTPSGQGVESPEAISDEILDNMNKPEAGAEPAAAETPAAETPAAEPAAAETPAAEEPVEEEDPKKEFQEAVGKLGQVINTLQDQKAFDVKDIKNVMNSVISAIGKEGFKEVGDNVVDSFIKKIRGSQESIKVDDTEELPAEEAPEELPAEEAPAEEGGEEKLNENFLRSLKKEAKQLLREQLEQELIKRKKHILIEQIKRKLK
jgi:hypothetical protein